MSKPFEELRKKMSLEAQAKAAILARFEAWYMAQTYHGASKEVLFHDWLWDETVKAEVAKLKSN